MADIRTLGATSNLVRFTLKHATTGQGLTGLTSASTGLRISTIADNEATATAYTVAGSTIESITTLGTFATPTATKCRFKEVDATNHKGLYEFQLDNARFAVSSAKRLIISVTGATNLLDADYEIQFDPPVNTVQVGGTAQTAADVVANVTTLLARLGPYTGSGVNTNKGYLEAIMRKDATLPSDIGGTFTDVTDSLEAAEERTPFTFV